MEGSLFDCFDSSIRGLKANFGRIGMCAGKAALALRGSSLLTLERQNAQVKVTSGLFCCFIRKLFSFLSLSFVKVMFSFGSYVNILPN